ncbi:MATE family efflux transporter [Zhongshania sp.]|uniref:MATE family efflux transporter n=1 Tax=Zhongshania sp. TaxID=1971902 RepID=UPI003565A7F1
MRYNTSPEQAPTTSTRVWALAWPMILANLSVPLLGLVDTAILGHLSDSRYLSAVAISTSLLAFLYWGFGFLRMGTTGASAQLLSRPKDANALLLKAAALGLTIAAFIWVAGLALSEIGLGLMNTPDALLPLAKSYLHIRLFSAPAVLCTYVIVGWLIGRQQTRWPLIIAVTTNGVNIVLDWLFIIVLEMSSDGAALASAISEYCGLAIGLWAVRSAVIETLRQGLRFSWRYGPALSQLLNSNVHLFIRTAALLFSFAFFTAQGAVFGQSTVAANAILLQLMLVSAYGMDGFAHAAEALIGEAFSEGRRDALASVSACCARYCLATALGASLLLWLGQGPTLNLMTDIEAVRHIANSHYGWLIIMPVICAPSYLLDGVFIGALKTQAMQWSMLASVAIIYLPVWLLSKGLENHGLWLSFCAFNLARSLSLALLYKPLVLNKTAPPAT